MNNLHWGLLFFTLHTVTANSADDFEKFSDLETDQELDLPRYVVFPGLDVESEEIDEWNVGFASPFNVFFGPKPYILGWVGQAPFGPVDEEGEEEVIEGQEGEEGETEGEVEEEEAPDPDYDYEKL